MQISSHRFLDSRSEIRRRLNRRWSASVSGWGGWRSTDDCTRLKLLIVPQVGLATSSPVFSGWDGQRKPLI